MSETISNRAYQNKFLQAIANYLYSVVPKQENWREWKKGELVLFRFFFIFLLLLILPIDWKIYRDFFSINWLHLHLHDLFRLSKYQVQFIDASHLPKWGIGAFANWGIAIFIAAAGSFVWGRIDANKKEYNVLYYWLRVIVRYRLAFVLVTYGFIKLFPLQMPYPSLSNLYTNYGDYFSWKIYFQTVGIAPKYESFLGFVEILAAFLLINRKTVTFGVGLIFGFIGNVAVANGFYDIGELVTSSFIVLLAVFLFVKDIPRLYNLLVNELPTRANKFIPSFNNPNLRKIRLYLRSAFFLFVLLFAYKSYDSFANDPYKVPKTPGLSNAYGIYNVKQFSINGDTLAYSKTDPNRWQDVIFEKWSTLTIKSNKPVKIDFSSGEVAAEKDIDRNYELAGFAGRHYFYYDSDTIQHTLSLQNKNKNSRNEKMFLHYDRPNDSTIVLKGINENSDSVYVLLTKVDKKYMMYEGRRKQVKI